MLKICMGGATGWTGRAIAEAVSSTFAHGNSRLTITHDAGKDPTIYADGTLLAARKAMELTGLERGLDQLL